MMLTNKYYILLILLLNSCLTYGQELTSSVEISDKISLFEDKEGNKKIEDIIFLNEFEKNDKKVPNLGVTKSSIWVKLDLSNNKSNRELLLELANPILDHVEFYHVIKDSIVSRGVFGESLPYDERIYNHQNYVFPISLKSKSNSQVYIKIKSEEQIQIPLFIGSEKSTRKRLTLLDISFAIFFGILLAMLIYNVFIFYTVRDKAYLYYVLYIAAVLLLQLSFQGYSIRFLWSNSPNFAMNSVFIFSGIVPIIGLFFLREFLNTKAYSNILDKIIIGFIILTAILLVLGVFVPESQPLIQVAGMLSALYAFFVALKMSISGNRSARFYLLAWSIFLIGVFVFVLKDIGILPYNNITNYTMPAGVTIELLLLSFALADQINIFRTEKEESQRKTLEVLQENEKIIKEQNIVLEQKVEERTTELNQTLSDLKEAQSQLVDAEKMSSLGQLTAGIAHEINNPINFVSSNIAPLRQDIDDVNAIIKKYEELNDADDIAKKLEEIEELKKELDFEYLKTELSTIIDGIEDGAKRTTEIVSGLRNFSRLDEGEFKKVNINEGIEATLVLIKNKLNGIKLEKSLGNIPSIECNPGKINQMAMNIIDNAIYAIDKKDIENKNGLINVITENSADHVVLTIKDNGIGIPDDIRDKLFDPFFTTKDVGEGTGLGLSIVRSIIESHEGKITVNSEINKGTEIIVEIPIKRESDGKN